MRRLSLVAVFVLAAVAAVFPTGAAGHLHPFVPASACAPSATGAGNESVAFFVAPGIIEHWDIVDLLPGVPGIQFLIQLSNPGKADQSQGAIAPPGIFLGNPGVAMATTRCAGAS